MNPSNQGKWAYAEERMLASLSPEAGWLLLHLRVKSGYPMRHADSGSVVELSYDALAKITRCGKGRVRSIIEELVSGGWILFQAGGGHDKSIFACLLQPEHGAQSEASAAAKAAFALATRRSTRRELLRAAGPKASRAEWVRLKAEYGNRCLACGKLDGGAVKLQRDHVVPLTLGGSNQVANLQPLCGPCNRRKGTKVIDYRSSATASDVAAVEATMRIVPSQHVTFSRLQRTQQRRVSHKANPSPLLTLIQRGLQHG